MDSYPQIITLETFAVVEIIKYPLKPRLFNINREVWKKCFIIKENDFFGKFRHYYSTENNTLIVAIGHFFVAFL